MLKIRLKRVGRKNDPSFRVVLTDSRKAASKGEKEILGTYDPRRNDSKLNADKIKEWMSKGAQVSDTVYNLLVNLKIVDGKKRDVRPTIKVAEKEPVVAEVKEEVKESTPKEASEGEAPKEDLPAQAGAPAEEKPIATEEPAVVEEVAPGSKEEEPKQAE